MTDDSNDRGPMAHADLVMAVVLVGLGVVLLYLSWTMPRLEVRRVPIYTVPGLVPGLLSLALTIAGAVLGIRAWRARSPGGWTALRAAILSPEAGRALAAVALALIFTLGLVGRLPFWSATAIFVFAFIAVFELWLTDRPRRLLATLAWGTGLAAATAALVVLVFQYGFLVRLP